MPAPKILKYCTNMAMTTVSAKSCRILTQIYTGYIVTLNTFAKCKKRDVNILIKSAVSDSQS